LTKAENIVDVKPFAIKTIDDVANDLNSFYQIMMVRMFNCTDNRIKIAPDVVAQSAFWVVKKRYTLLKVYNMELKKDIDEVEVKGLDVVRSSYPKKFRDFMKSVLIDILRGVTNKEVNTKITEFKSKMAQFELEDIAKNTSVRFISNTNAKINFDPKDRDMFNFIDGSTAQCKAALAYNDMLKRYNLSDTEPILSGGKIKWVYENTNIDRFIFLQDSIVIRDNDLLMSLFDTDGSSCIMCGPRCFGSYLGLYERNTLSQLDIPEISSKLEAVQQEIDWRARAKV
jgi:hypothetical protein